MIKKANISWTAKQVVKMIDKGTINFDNAVQRGYVWDNVRKSILIDSMIQGYPIPAFYASKNENGYDMLDGKQRASTIKQFINNEFVLCGLSEINFNDEILDLNGKKFSELSEEIQDEITSYSLTVYYFDGITDDEINELFFRLNNGKPLTAIELTRVKAKSIDTIKKLGKHEMFTEALTEKSINKYNNEDIVIKTWFSIYGENPSFDTKTIRKILETADITAEQQTEINDIFSNIISIHNIIKADITDEKLNVKICKRIYTRTHLISVCNLVKYAIDNRINMDKIATFLMEFYAGKKSASICDVYNDNASAGSATASAVKSRHESIINEFKKFNG